MITGISESKTLTKHISCECKCEFDGRKCNSHQWWDNNKCQCMCKKCHVCEKNNVWNPATCNCENGKYLTSVMDDSSIIFNEVIDADADAEDKAKSNDEAKLYNKTNFNEKKATYNTQNFQKKVLLKFLLITIVLLIAVSIYLLLSDKISNKTKTIITISIHK